MPGPLHASGMRVFGYEKLTVPSAVMVTPVFSTQPPEAGSLLLVWLLFVDAKLTRQYRLPDVLLVTL